MRASLPILVLTLTLAACHRSGGASGATGTADGTPATEHDGFVLTQVDPAAGDLGTALGAGTAKAKAQGLRPYVELSATWCKPCQAIKKNLDDPRMKAAFKGTYIMQFDIDAWGKKLPEAGFRSTSIPVFFAVDDAGRPTGRKIGGGAWKEDVPENMAPKLDRFFHGS